MGVGAVVMSRMYELCSQEDGAARKQRANLKKHVTGEPFTGIGINISEPYNFTADGNNYKLFQITLSSGVSHEGYGSQDSG